MYLNTFRRKIVWLEIINSNLIGYKKWSRNSLNERSSSQNPRVALQSWA